MIDDMLIRLSKFQNVTVFSIFLRNLDIRWAQQYGAIQAKPPVKRRTPNGWGIALKKRLLIFI